MKEELQSNSKDISRIVSESSYTGGYIVTQFVSKIERREIRIFAVMIGVAVFFTTLVVADTFVFLSEIPSPSHPSFTTGFYAGLAVGLGIALLYKRSRIKGLASLAKNLRDEARLTDEEVEEIEKELETLFKKQE